MTNTEKIHHYLETLPDSGRLDYPIYIPTYKNRKPSLLDNLQQFADTPIYVSIYEDEVELYDLLEQPNITKIIVPVEYRGIQPTKKYIQNILRDLKVWMIDDDLKGFKVADKFNSSNKKVPVSIYKGCRLIELLCTDGEWSMISPSDFVTEVSFSDPDKKLWSNLMCVTCILINNPKIFELGAQYTGDISVTEDKEVTIQLHYAGLPGRHCTFLYSEYYFRPGTKKSLASPEEIRWERELNHYIKFGNAIKFKVSKGKITALFDWPEIKRRVKNKDFEVRHNPEILKYCIERDYTSLEQFLLNPNCRDSNVKKC